MRKILLTVAVVLVATLAMVAHGHEAKEVSAGVRGIVFGAINPGVWEPSGHMLAVPAHIPSPFDSNKNGFESDPDNPGVLESDYRGTSRLAYLYFAVPHVGGHATYVGSGNANVDGWMDLNWIGSFKQLPGLVYLQPKGAETRQAYIAIRTRDKLLTDVLAAPGVKWELKQGGN